MPHSWHPGYGEIQEQHNKRLRAVLKCLQEAGLTLNDKSEFLRPCMKFLGHIIDCNGVYPDPKNNRSNQALPNSSRGKWPKRFLGMVNYMGKFLPGLSKLNEPLRQLFKRENDWVWEGPQQQAFDKIKEKLTSSSSLAHYDPIRPTNISWVEIGAVLLQLQDDGTRRPVSYASTSLSQTEKRYTVIEKEPLAITWAREFTNYVLSMQFTLETDAQPLFPLLSSTDLSRMPPRILRFCMRLLKHNQQVVDVPGNNQVLISDTNMD